MSRPLNSSEAAMDSRVMDVIAQSHPKPVSWARLKSLLGSTGLEDTLRNLVEEEAIVKNEAGYSLPEFDFNQNSLWNYADD